MLIFRFSHPKAFFWFYSSAATLGYRTRITLLLVVAPIIGHTLTSAINFCAGAIAGVIGALTPYKPFESYDIARGVTHPTPQERDYNAVVTVEQV